MAQRFWPLHHYNRMYGRDIGEKHLKLARGRGGRVSQSSHPNGVFGRKYQVDDCPLFHEAVLSVFLIEKNLSHTLNFVVVRPGAKNRGT